MKALGNMTREELTSLPLKNYFEWFEAELTKSIGLEELTELFTNRPYEEKKPYLIRRQLQPVDERFKKIEIVYDAGKPVGAIVWWFKVTLRELVNIFGKPILHYEPYSESMAFAFMSKNPDIDIIKTRYSQASNDMIELKELESVDVKSISDRILNLEFTFLQFDLKE